MLIQDIFQTKKSKVNFYSLSKLSQFAEITSEYRKYADIYADKHINKIHFLVLSNKVIMRLSSRKLQCSGMVSLKSLRPNRGLHGSRGRREKSTVLLAKTKDTVRSYGRRLGRRRRIGGGLPNVEFNAD